METESPSTLWSRTRPAVSEAGLAAAAYALLLVAALAIIGFNPFTHHLGGRFVLLSWSHVDYNVHLWNLWEFRRFFGGEPVLYHTSAEFFPVGLDTLTVQGDLLVKLVGGLFALVLGPNGTFLAMALLVFMGNAMGGYLLGKTLTGNRMAGFVSGLLLCFSGATAWSVNTGNLENGLWLWLCLYLSFLWRTLRDGRWSDAVLAGVACGATALSNLAVVHQLVPFSALLVLFSVRSLSRKKLARLGVMCLIVSALLLPLATAFSSAHQGEKPPIAVSLFVEHDASRIGALALPMLNSYPPDRYLPWKRVENTDPLDTHEYNKEDADTYYFVAVLMAFALLFAPRRSAPWLVAGLLFFSLSLGPFYVHVPEGGSPRMFSLPFRFAYQYVPLYDQLHFPHRLFNLAVVCMAAVVALGVDRLTRLPRRSTALAMAVLIAIGCAGELLSKWQVSQVPIAPTHPFHAQLAEDPEDYGIAVFPLDFGILDARYLYEQTRHRKPLFNGSVPRYFGEAGIPTFRMMQSNPILLRAYCLQEPYLLDRLRLTFVDTGDRSGLIHLHQAANARRQMAGWGLRYVVLMKRVEWEPGLALQLPADNALYDLFGATLGNPVYEDDLLAAFEIRP